MNPRELAMTESIAQAGVTVPVVIDLGKTRRRRIRRLKRGRGKLVIEAQQAVAELRLSLGAEAAGKEFVPVVIVYRQKRRRGKRFSLFPFFPGF
jgi:hypothetical protein